MRSNLAHWKQLQREGYFENHKVYGGLKDFGADEAVNCIQQFRPLTPESGVVVIGCGYGRESLGLAKQVRHVWGIDVSDLILEKAVKFLDERGVTNFTPVLAENYRTAIPEGVDVVFSIVVMQHLTRDLVNDYIASLARKLVPGGGFVLQFIESLINAQIDVDLGKVHEPSVSWSVKDLHKLAQNAALEFVEVRTIEAHATCLWHWAYFKRR